MEQQIIEESLWEELKQECDRFKDFDISKLKLTSQDNDTLNAFFKKFLDPSENFPQGARHSTIEKNFAIYIISNKIPLEQIQEAYKSKGFNIKSLTSQIRGVTSGTYGEEPNVNIGELVNWCKQNRPDLVDLFVDLKGLNNEKIIKRSDLIFPTAHLPYFNHIDKCTQIFGNEYIHLKKLLHHHLISGAIPDHLRIVRIGQIEIDLRDYLFLVYPSGNAKGNVKNFLIKIKRDLFQNIVSLTSFHPEQLIGRIVKRKEKQEDGRKRDGSIKYKLVEKFVKNYGHFISDEIVLDECKPLLTEREKEESRNFLLIAMDKYGQNEMYKRLTENLLNEEEVLRYFPKFNALFGTQPFNFPEEKIALNGFLKRVTTDYIPQQNREDRIFDNRLEDKTPISEFYDELVNTLREMKGIKSYDWTFSDDFSETFKKCYRNLRYAGLYNIRKKRNYTKLIEWQLQDRLLRKSCLIAIAKDKTAHINADHVELAFIDILEDFIIELEFVNDKIYGNLDYGSVWGTADKKEEDVLKWLYSYGATSEQESTISINALQQEIRQIYHPCGDENARKIYYKLINKELITSKQLGKNDSRVWLLKTPIFESGKGGNVGSKEFYYFLINKHFSNEGGKGGNVLEKKNVK